MFRPVLKPWLIITGTQQLKFSEASGPVLLDEIKGHS